MRIKLQSTSVGVFKRKGKFLIQPRDRTTAGVYIGTSPVLMAPMDVSEEELGKLVLRSFEVAEDGVPHPDDWTQFPHPLWDAAGVRSWAAFSKGTVNCDLYREGAALRIQPMKNMGAKRGFVLLKEHEKSIPANSPPNIIGKEILCAIELAEAKEE